MWDDPIVAKVRETREKYAAQFDFDLNAMVRALKEAERQTQREKVSFAPKRSFPAEETKLSN